MTNIQGGRRVAMAECEHMPGWYVGYSPRNGEGASVEGDWDDWVALAKGILEEDEKRKKAFETALAATNEQYGGALKKLADQ